MNVPPSKVGLMDSLTMHILEGAAFGVAASVSLGMVLAQIVVASVLLTGAGDPLAQFANFGPLLVIGGAIGTATGVTGVLDRFEDLGAIELRLALVVVGLGFADRVLLSGYFPR